MRWNAQLRATIRNRRARAVVRVHNRARLAHTRRNTPHELTSRAQRSTRPATFHPRGRDQARIRKRGNGVGSVIKKRRKKMRKHKKRKLLKRARHKRKR